MIEFDVGDRVVTPAGKVGTIVGRYYGDRVTVQYDEVPEWQIKFPPPPGQFMPKGAREVVLKSELLQIA